MCRLDKGQPQWFSWVVRILVKCTNESCSQHDKIKSVLAIYLGNGVYQRPQPVCNSCDGLRDMAVVEEQ